MSLYQRYLSKSLIFFSIFFVIFLLFIESSMGFQWFFNFTSRFLIGFKVEAISGNWRDFTLKHIKYNIFGISIKAHSVHVVLDMKSLFKLSTIFKEIKAKKLIISLKKNILTDTNIKNISTGAYKKNIFIKCPIIFQKIQVDKILLKTSTVNISFLNVLSGVEFINNKIIFSPTYIDTIHVLLPKIYLNKTHIINQFNLIKNMNSSEKVHNILYSVSNKTKIFVPLNINLKFFKCKKINFKHANRNNVFQAKLEAKLEKNILKIKQLQINSSFFKIKTYGKMIIHHDNSISCIINNKIFIPRFHKKIINILFTANLTNKFRFKLQTDTLHKSTIHGIVLLDHLDYPFYIQLKIQNILFPIKKDVIFKLNKFHGILTGTINDYSLSIKNIFSIIGMPSIFVKINGQGNLKNIYIKNIKCFPIKQKIINKKNITLKKNIQNSKYILKLIGKIHLAGISDNNIYNLYLPKINLKSNFMKKKISILGSLYYKNFNLLEIPGINLFAGKNKIYLKGSLGDQYNIYSSLRANHLDYFLPNLKGRIKAQTNCYGQYMFPSINSKILADDLSWNNIYLKSIKIFTNININSANSGNIVIDSKKIYFPDFQIDSLYMQTQWNNYKQKFHFSLNSHQICINVILNGITDHKTRNWYGFFKKINIKTFFGSITIKKGPLVSYSDSDHTINDFYKKNIQIKDVFSFFTNQTRKYLYNILNPSFINFKSKISINTKLQWTPGDSIYNGKILFTGSNIILEKKTTEKIFLEEIDYLRVSINIINNAFKSKWIINKIKTSSKQQNIIGHLNIIDLYNKRNIEGIFTISHFPVSFLNFFTTNFKQAKGTFQSDIKILGTLYQPKVLANINLQNIFIKSDNILKYMTLFFPYFLGKTENIRINQEVIMRQGNILFTLNSIVKNSSNIEWNLLFNSKKIEVAVLPKIKLKFSSQLNLHYLFLKYDLIGYIKFSFFHFNINEKNFVF